MNHDDFNISRRNLVKAMLALGVSGSVMSGLLQAATLNRIQKAIPKSGEQIPVIGLGTSRTFDALHDEQWMQQLKPVLQAFFNHQGTLIDSSPMYGTAQAVIGQLLKQVSGGKHLFAATKVWIDGRQDGIEQMERSRQLWGIKHFDLMQIHNLRDWEVHLETLKEMKAEGRIRYIGITTSHGRFHDELVSILEKHPFDFVQFSYNIADREVERYLLPVAMDRGIAVIINRPYQKGHLFRRIRGKSLPDWAGEINVSSWGQFFLKFIVSHPGVSCAIPATSKVKHMIDNMGAQFGRLPDAAMRKEMLAYFHSLK